MNAALHQQSSLLRLREILLEVRRPILGVVVASLRISPNEAVAVHFPPGPATPGIASATVRESENANEIDQLLSHIVHAMMIVQIGRDEIANLFLPIALLHQQGTIDLTLVENARLLQSVRGGIPGNRSLLISRVCQTLRRHIMHQLDEVDLFGVGDEAIGTGAEAGTHL